MFIKCMKSIIFSILAILGLQKNTPPVIDASSLKSYECNGEIIDENPVTQTDITPEDLERPKMLSARFCGPLQAQLFDGIIQSDYRKIDDAIEKGANLYKPSNCWAPLDEAIEQAIKQRNKSILMHLFHKYKIPVLPDHISRLRNKIFALETNYIQDPQNAHELTNKTITLDPTKNMEEMQKQAIKINSNLEEEIAQCEEIIRLFEDELRKQTQTTFQTQASKE